jgi:hypothetical protein
MENLLYFGLFWILTGAGNYLVFLIELKVKGLNCSKKFKRKYFKLSLALGFSGLILSAYLLIFPKK